MAPDAAAAVAAATDAHVDVNPLRRRFALGPSLALAKLPGMFAGILLLGIIIGLICIVAGIRAENAAQRTRHRRGSSHRPSRHTPQDTFHSAPDIYPSALLHAQALGAAHSTGSGAHAASPSPTAHDCPCDTSASCHDSGGSGSCDSGGGGGGSCGCD